MPPPHAPREAAGSTAGAAPKLMTGTIDSEIAEEEGPLDRGVADENSGLAPLRGDGRRAQ